MRCNQLPKEYETELDLASHLLDSNIHTLQPTTLIRVNEVLTLRIALSIFLVKSYEVYTHLSNRKNSIVHSDKRLSLLGSRKDMA
jgi:hypothetical protein